MAGAAVAQDVPAADAGVTLPIYQIARPGYDPLGIRLGPFLVFPSFSENVVFNDNIFASEQRLASDFINTTTEQVSVTAQSAPYDVRLHLLASQELYTQHSSNDGFVWNADAGVRIALAREAFLQLDGAIGEQPLARGTAEAGGDPKRPVFNSADFSAADIHRIGDFTNRAQFALRDIAYVSEQDASRSGTRFTYRDRFSYEFRPEQYVFLEASFAQQHWKLRSDVRNFNLLTGLGGLSFDLPGRLKGELSLGVVQQSYRDSAFRDLVAPIVAERLVWNITPLTSIIASADRAVFGTETFCKPAAGGCSNASGGVLPGSPGLAPQRNSLDITTGEIVVQREFHHDILGEAGVRYERDYFDFNGLTDRTFVARTGVRYLLNRFLEADLDYTWRKRTANLPADRTFNSGPYTENVVSLTLRGGI